MVGAAFCKLGSFNIGVRLDGLTGMKWPSVGRTSHLGMGGDVCCKNTALVKNLCRVNAQSFHNVAALPQQQKR